MTPTPYQTSIMECPDTVNLILVWDDASRDAALMCALRAADHYGKNVAVLFSGKAFDNAADVLQTMLREIYGTGLRFNRVGRAFSLPNGAVLEFTGLGGRSMMSVHGIDRTPSRRILLTDAVPDWAAKFQPRHIETDVDGNNWILVPGEMA